MIQKNAHIIIALLLITLSVLLTILVPGGPIETRDFSHYSPLVLSLFNIFLTSLGILSFLVAFLIFKKKRYSLILSAIFAWCYILVYLLDLFKIFPTSKIDMPPALFFIEVISTFLALVLLYFCKNYQLYSKNDESIKLNISFSKIAVILIVLIFAIGIVIFATKSAMGI